MNSGPSLGCVIIRIPRIKSYKIAHAIPRQLFGTSCTLLSASELDRKARLHLECFQYWPYTATEGAACTAEKMAEAGFYCCGGQREPDLVRCYFCRKELVSSSSAERAFAETLTAGRVGAAGRAVAGARQPRQGKLRCAYINLDLQ